MNKAVLPGNNKGTTMIIMALALTMIMSCSALVIDVGRLAVERQKLQNAVDAAALAAASKLPDAAGAEEAARTYAGLNGVDPSEINVTFSDSDKTVDITANTSVKFVFAQVLGFCAADTGADAAATADTIGGPFDYTLFSGSATKSLTMNGSNIYVGGDSHSNKNFTANGSNLTITGSCEACTTINVNGSNINIGSRIPDASYIAMPDFSQTIMLEAENTGTHYIGNKTFNGSNINVGDSIYVEGNVTINGSDFAGKGCILATGSITFNGSSLTCSSDDAVCFYSKTGNITINGSNAEVHGILYAPSGSIIMNGSNQSVYGSAIGNSLSFNGSGLYFIGGTTELGSLPTYGIKLVK